MTDHSITPPPELVHKWATMFEFLPDKQVFSEVAQWGADQELEACCEWFANEGYGTAPDRIRNHRRPTPPTDKELALRELDYAYDKNKIDDTTYAAIKRALETIHD